MQNIELLHEDYKNQLIASDTGIAENTAILARVEPGKWMRLITGTFYFVLEVILYLLVLALLFLAIYFYTHWLAFTVSLGKDASIDATIHSPEVDILGNLITGMFVFAALVTLGLALILRRARKNLFKLADASAYLEKTLAARKERRDKIISILVEVGKSETTDKSL